jgi:hypothetical protein
MQSQAATKLSRKADYFVKLRLFSIVFCALMTAIVFSVQTVNPAFADFNATDWKYLREITGRAVIDNGEGKPANNNAYGDEKYGTLQLDELVYGRCRDDFADLRVVDAAGEEVPFKLIESKGNRSASELKVKVLNMSESTGKTTFVIDTGGRSWIHNRILFDVSAEGFVAKAKVEGSADQQKWSTLSENALIYDLRAANDLVRNTDITYPNSDYRFMRVTIKNNDSVRVSINSVRVERVKETPSKEREVIETGFNLKKNKDRSFAVIDLKHRQPSNRIELKTSNINFYRQVVVYGSNKINDEDKKDWVELGGDVIYEFETPEQSSLPHYKSSKMSVSYESNGFYRYLKLEIIDADDQPLKTGYLRVFDYERQLFFKTGRQPLSLFYDNPKALSPVYDIEKVYPYIETVSTISAKLGSERENRNFIPPKKPWSEENPGVLWIVLVAIGGIIAVFCLRLIRQIIADKA